MSSAPDDRTPVLVGAGQGVWREQPADLDRTTALHPMDCCAHAVRQSLEDVGLPLDLARVLQSITVVRMFEDSGPRRAHKLGRSNNPPRSVAQRIGADPAEAVYTTAGGETPQRKLNELSERIAHGELDCALLCGVENVATVRHLQRLEVDADVFSEEVEGSLDDEGFGTWWFDQHQLGHRVAAPIHCYPLLEHAVRRERGNTLDQHLLAMACLFAPLSEVAAKNPYAYRQVSYSVEQLATPSGRNRMISHPYGRLLNARDSVDLASAVVLMSYRRARELGVATERIVFLHGCADVSDRVLMLEREAFHRSAAARVMAETAFEMAGIGVDDLASMDLYSCFPSAVEIVAAEMGVSENDSRGLTTTGGLPYFGGPGNSYSLHAIAEAVERARRDPGTYHWVSANGGNINKQSAGIYSTRPYAGAWRRPDPAAAQGRIEALPMPESTREPTGRATIETYTVAFAGDSPDFGIVVGRDEHGRRFLSNVPTEDGDTVQALLESGFDVVGTVRTADGLSTFSST